MDSILAIPNWLIKFQNRFISRKEQDETRRNDFNLAVERVAEKRAPHGGVNQQILMKTNQYSLTNDDIVAFVEFSFAQSASRRRYLQRMRIITFVCMLISLSLVSWLTKSYIFIVLGGPISFAFYLQYPNMMKTIAINAIKKKYLDGENENIYPERTIDIQSEKIILNNEKSESSIAWKSIENYWKTINTFIFLLRQRRPL